MAAPYIVAAALIGAGILGYWLLGPKQSATGKPSTMPDLNSSMRGSVLGVSFGSNRITAQMGWQKNFAAIRQPASGKKGGSGGFGSAKGGGSAAQSYIYKWDMIFNYGIMDQPCYIRRGWIGGDLIERDNLNTLTGGDTDAAIVAYGSTTALPNEQTAKLSYESAHVARGYGTGDVNLTSWAYFQAQEGVACAFPYNAWLGFQQLNLGQTPSIPQLSMEFVPIPLAGGLTVNAEYGGTITTTTIGSISTLNGAMSNGFLFANGKHYSVIQDDVSTLHMVCVEDSTHHALSSAQFQADLALHGMSMPGSSHVSDYNIGQFNLGAPGTSYIWVIGTTTDAGLFDMAGIMYSVSATGGWTIVGGLVAQSNSTFGFWALPTTYSTMTDGSTVVAVCDASVNLGTKTTGIISLPLGGDHVYTPSGWATLWTDVSPSANFLHDLFGNNRTDRGGAAVVAVIGSSYVAYTYIGQAEYDYIVAHPTGNAGWSAIAAPGCYQLTSGGAVPMDFGGFSDRMTDLTGDVSVDYRDDYTVPTFYVADGATYLAFSRGYSTLNNAGEVVMRTRIISWDGTTSNEVADLQSAIFNPVVDLGDSGGVAPFEVPDAMQVYQDETGALKYQYMSNVETGYRYVWGSFADSGTSTMDVTPAYIVYRILTSPVFGFATSALFGFAITPERIDQGSYLLAKDWCEQQGLFISCSYITPDNVLSILEELLSLFNGFLTDLGGTVIFNFVTGAETPERTIDNSHLVADEGKAPVKVTKSATDDSYNIVQLQYLDRTLEYNTVMVEESDEVDIDFTGPRIKQYQPRFTMAGSVAQMLARRALWQNLYAKDQYDFKLGWKDADLHQGALITLVDSFDQTLSNGVRTRILKWKEDTRGQFTVTGVREFPYIMAASASYTQTQSVNGGFGSIVQTPTPMLDFRAYELPKEFQTKAQLFFGYNQAFYNMGAQLYISHDGANYVLTQDIQPYIISGLFPNTLEQRPQGYCEEFVDFFLFPTSATASPTFVFSETIDDVSQALRAAGAGVFIVGSEAVSVENLTLLGTNHFRARRLYRGWGGTPIAAHPAAALWHYHAAGIFAHDLSPDDIGTRLSYKILGYNFAGEGYDLSSVDARTYTIRGDYWLPRAQPRTSIFVQSAQAWPASVAVTGPYIGVTSGGCDVELTWPNASNEEGYGAGGYGAGGYGHFDADSIAWRVDVKSSNGTKVSSFFSNSPSFNYGLAQNSADFAGFAHDLIFSVTPYTVKGDGPVADTRSLSMNW